MPDHKSQSFAQKFFAVRQDRAHKRAVIGIVLFIAFSAAYGFWDGYHHGRSIADAIVSVVAAVAAVVITAYLLK